MSTLRSIAAFLYCIGSRVVLSGCATTTSGAESLTLSDGTHISFQGFTGLTAANFL